MDRQIYQVFESDEYDKFKKLLGNRDVSKARLGKIAESIKTSGYLYQPILVNDRFEVIDGQGRLAACKQLGIPVQYVIQPGIGIDDCVALNQFQENWKIRDYIKSYADAGYSSYVLLEKLLARYNGTPLSLNVICNAITGTIASSNPQLKSGTFKCTDRDYENAINVLEYDLKFGDALSGSLGNTQYYYIAIHFLYSHPDVDNDRLIEKSLMLRQELYPVSNVEQALERLETVYNNRARCKVYMVTDYKIMLSDKYGWYQNRHGK